MSRALRIDPEERYEIFLASVRAEVPGFQVVRKDQSFFQRLIHYTLCVVTLGRMRGYLTQFLTTIGKTVYVSSDWEQRSFDDKYALLRHEAVHLRQFKKLTLPLMTLLYVFLPLPLGLAYFRARFEKEAYAESIRVAAELWGVEYARSSVHREFIVGQFTGPSYGWMWPFRKSLDKWYDDVLSTLLS